MLELEENLRILEELKERLLDIKDSMKIEKLIDEKNELEEKSLKEDFWNNQEESSIIFSKIKTLQKKINLYNNLKSQTDNLIELNKLLESEYDNDLYKELLNSTTKLKHDLDKLEIQTLILIMLLLLFIQEQEELNLKIGFKCFIECMANGQVQMDLLLKN